MMDTVQLSLEMANCVHIPLRKLIRSNLDEQTDFCERHMWQCGSGVTGLSSELILH